MPDRKARLDSVTGHAIVHGAEIEGEEPAVAPGVEGAGFRFVRAARREPAIATSQREQMLGKKLCGAFYDAHTTRSVERARHAACDDYREDEPGLFADMPSTSGWA